MGGIAGFCCLIFLFVLGVLDASSQAASLKRTADTILYYFFSGSGAGGVVLGKVTFGLVDDAKGED